LAIVVNYNTGSATPQHHSIATLQVAVLQHHINTATPQQHEL
jgi:hypothetical protein